MTTKTATIVGPITDATLTPQADARVTVRIVTGDATLATFPDGTVVAAATVRTDSTGHPTSPLVLPLNSEAQQTGTYYQATAGSAVWSFRLDAGDDGQSVQWGDLAHTVTSPTPPDWVPVKGDPGPQGTPTTVNGKTGASITLTASDVGADPAGSAAAVAAVAATKAANLSDLVNVVTARTNLGLGTAAVADVGTGAATVAAGNDSRIVGAEQVAAKNTTGGYAGLEATGTWAGKPHPKRLGRKAWTIPGGWGDTWREAKARAATQLVTGIGIGDSIMCGWADDASGSGKTWPQISWAWQAAAAIQAQLGDGGSGFLPAALIPSAMSLAAGVPGSKTGTWTSFYWGSGGTWATDFNRAAGGPNGDSIVSDGSIGSTITFPACRGTTIQVWYVALPGQGKFIASIDGVDQPEVDAGAFLGWTSVSYAVSAGPHTVTIRTTAALPIAIAGIRGFNGTGFMFDNFALPGRRSGDLVTVTHRHKLVITGGTGTFTLAALGRTSAPIAWNAGVGPIRDAITALVDPTGTSVVVGALESPTGTLWIDWETGAYHAQKVPPLTATGSGGCTATLSTVANHEGADRVASNAGMTACTTVAATGTPAPSLAITSLGINDPGYPGVGAKTERHMDMIHATLENAWAQSPSLLVVAQHANTDATLNGAFGERTIAMRAAAQRAVMKNQAAVWDLMSEATRTQWRTAPTVFLGANLGAVHPTIAGHDYIGAQVAQMLLDA